MRGGNQPKGSGRKGKGATSSRPQKRKAPPTSNCAATRQHVIIARRATPSNTSEESPRATEKSQWEEKDVVTPTLKRPVMEKTSADEDAVEHGAEGQECPGEGLGTSTTVH